MKQLICIEGKLNEGMLVVIGCEESYNKYCQKGEAEDEGGTGSTRMVFCFLFFFMCRLLLLSVTVILCLVKMFVFQLRLCSQSVLL